MDCCILCLEVNNVIIECIKSNTKRWQELDIENIIKKHFWTLNTIQNNSWICSSCWQDVDDFHNFYLRVEEAHVNFGKMKDVETERDKLAICFLETEMHIDKEHQCNLTEPEISIEEPATHVMDENIAISKPIDERGSDNMPLIIKCRRLRRRSDIANKDPLEKIRKFKKKKISTKENIIKGSNLEVEPFDINEGNLNKISNNYKDISDATEQLYKASAATKERKRRRANNKHHPNRKENDKFISEHFQQMFCDICKIRLQDFPDMQKHFTEAHNQRGYFVCCKRKFSDRTRLVDHLHCHLNPDHFKCKECGKTMSDRIKFHNHMLRVHRPNEVVKQHCCIVCGKSFREAYVLRTHKLTHLPEEEKKCPCVDCGKNYGSSYLLNQHRQVVHLKRFVKVCYICGKEINTSAEFRAHMNKHEGIPLPAIHCDVCGLRLTSERGLKVHKESQHPIGGKQKHPCPLCDKVSPTARALKKHVHTMHEKGFDHKCTMCEKAFRRTEALKEHMASHTGTPLYACPWCPMTFNSNGNMHSHRKNKHSKEYLELKLQNYSFPLIS